MEKEAPGIFGRMTTPLRISMGSDHAGFAVKEHLVAWTRAQGYEVVDHGTHGEESVDYPGFAHAVARDVEQGGFLGVVVCGSGNGVNISANKHPGVRSALAWRPDVAALARQHNDANVLAIPGRYVTPQEAEAILQAFLQAGFEGGRHQRRVEAIEQQGRCTSTNP